MSAFLSSLAGIPGMGSNATAGPSENRSINFVGGAAGGSFADLNRLIGISQGPSTNGGFSSLFGGGNDRYVSAGAETVYNTGINIPVLVMIGVIGLALYSVMRK